MRVKYFLLLLLIIIASCKDEVSNSISEGLIQPIVGCLEDDSVPPNMNGSLTLSGDGTSTESPEITWQKATGDCEMSHYEIAIGSGPGLEDIMPYSNIGNVTTYTQQNLTLTYPNDYYTSVKAVDAAGNPSAPIVSSSWQIFTPTVLPGLIVWLDAAQKSSIEDGSGNTPDSSSISNVAKWSDVSGSTTVHDFSDSVAEPSWDASDGSLKFNGTDQFLATPNDNEINLGTSFTEKTVVVVIKTSNDVTTRQVIYEEGGGLRGVNIYIDNGFLRCGFWNNTDDGDGIQDLIDHNIVAETNKKYVITQTYKYNTTSGDVECFINGTSLGSQQTVSKLFSHNGEIGLGAVNEGSFFFDGGGTAPNGDEHHYNGNIYEFLMYDTAPSSANVLKLDSSLQNKWF